MFVKWMDDRHSVKIDAIDNQHKELFLITNRIHEILAPGYSNSLLYGLLKRLYHYTRYHFTNEEGLFIKYKYAGLAEHRATHLAFTEKIKESLISFRNGEKINIEELLDFLVNWIITHIQGDDRKYAEFFISRGIELDPHFSIDTSGANLGEDVLVMWKKKDMSLNLTTIDYQHKELITILMQVNDLNKQGVSDKRKSIYLPVIIKKLFHYSGYHFLFEEELMAKYDYPAIGEHKKLHKEFMDKIVTFTKEFKDHKESLIDEMIIFLKNWAFNHIMVEDKKYKSYFSNE